MGFLFALIFLLHLHSKSLTMEKPAIFKLYKNWRGQWRWQLKSAHNGKIIGASSEGFKNRGDAIDNALLNLTGLKSVNFEEL